MITVSTRLRRLQERVRNAVSHVALFPLVRRLERDLAGRAPIGADQGAEDERVHFSHPPTFSLPAGELLDVEYAQEGDGAAATVTTSLLGLLGAESPLPPATSEEVLFEDDDALAAFYDVFHHRALALLYRAWKRYAPSAALERSGADAFSRALLSLVGTDAFSPYQAATSVDPMFALGFSDFVRCEPSFLDESALETLLRRVFPELNPRVTTSEPRVVQAADEDRSCLGSQHTTLGEDASYGASALDVNGTVRIQVGPVDRQTYEALLPGGDRHRQIQPLVETWLASRAVAELDILVAAEDAPALCLGEAYGGTLGVDAQYRAPDTRHVRARVPLPADPGGESADYVDEVPAAAAFDVPADRRAEVEKDAVEVATPVEAWKAALALLGGAELPPTVRGVVEGASRVAVAGRADAALDLLIRALDDIVSEQVDAVLHHPTFQTLEARWRGIEYLVGQVPFQENIEVTLIDCSKESLIEDLASSSELVRSRIFSEVYSSELGTFGGKPYGAILADMAFDSTPRDVQLLRQMTGLATMAHTPFFAAASPRLLQLDSWRELPRVRSARAVFEATSQRAWSILRDAEDARTAGLLVGRPLHRAPYGGAPADVCFDYTETIGAHGEGLLFGSPIYVMGARLAASFARHRTLAAIVGDDDDACPAPATLSFPSLGSRYTRPPLEVTITPRLEQELRDAGLIALGHRTDSPRIFLPSANSLQRPKKFGASEGGREATLNHLLGTKFPYFYVACRFAHYIKVLEREMIGAHRSAEEIEGALTEWLSQYVLQMNSASAALRARHPLRGARVRVTPVPESPGWNRGEIQIRPHLRYLDRFFTLSVMNWIPQGAAAAPPVSRPWESS
ncbi:MAG: type VI secretion system contractile sheath large subunit [Polyangiaceae bacterium]